MRSVLPKVKLPLRHSQIWLGVVAFSNLSQPDADSLERDGRRRRNDIGDGLLLRRPYLSQNA